MSEAKGSTMLGRWARCAIALSMVAALGFGSGCATGRDAAAGSSLGATATGIDNARDYPDSPFVIDLGRAGYATMDIAMGALPWGVVSFEAVPSEAVMESLDADDGDEEAIADALAAWADSATSAWLDGIELVRRPCKEWAVELEDPATDAKTMRYFDVVAFDDYAKIRVPVCLFDLDGADDGISRAHLSVRSSDHATVEGDVAYRDCGADELVVRVVDRPAISANCTILSETVFSEDELRALGTIEGYATSANCGMAGLRSFYSEAVELADILDAAGIDFGPGMELQLRVSDSTSTWESDASEQAAYYCGYGSNGTFDWEYLYGAPRYDYPAMWDDETTYEELGGKTVHELLAANKDVWKDDSATARAIMRILGESKEQVEPIIALGRRQGVVAWGGADPSRQRGGETVFDPYSEHQYYGFHFGMLADEDGSAMNDNTMFRQAGVVFGIDIIDPSGTAVAS